MNPVLRGVLANRVAYNGDDVRQSVYLRWPGGALLATPREPQATPLQSSQRAQPSSPSFESGGQRLTRSLGANAKAGLYPGRFQQTQSWPNNLKERLPKPELRIGKAR
jgi:hypothetical protein